MASLPVYFEQRLVGTIDVDKSGPGFTYDPDWIGLRGAFPISTTMPLKSERIASDTFLPWAANLLPESEQLRTLGQLLGMARSDVIGLLSAIGGDTAGALSIGQPGRTASVHWQPVGKPEDLEKVMEELPNKPFLVGRAGRLNVPRWRADEACCRCRRYRPCLHPDERLSIDAHSQAGGAAPLGQRSERGVLPDLGETYEDPDSENHHRASRQTSLFTRAAIRPNVRRWPLASLAPGGLLSSRWDTAIRKVRIQSNWNSWADVEGHV